MADPGAISPQIRVRPGTAEDMVPARRLASQAFSAASVEEPVHEPAAAGDPSPSTSPLPRLDLVAEHQGKIVGTASAVLRGQWFGGRRMLSAAIGGVAVGVQARGLGVGRALMGGLQAAARDVGAVSSALIPSSHGFYTSVGYGVAGRRPVYALSTVELRELPAPRPAGMLLRKTAPADAGAVAELVSRRAARGNGLLDHYGPDPSTVDDPTGSDSYVVDVDGAVAGWCLLYRREPSSVRAAGPGRRGSGQPDREPPGAAARRRRGLQLDAATS